MVNIFNQFAHVVQVAVFKLSENKPKKPFSPGSAVLKPLIS
jgi:hypothetical protein